MRNVYTLLLMVGSLMPLGVLGQQLIKQGAPDWSAVERMRPGLLQEPTTRTVNCGIDTLDYALFKAADPMGLQVQLLPLSTSGGLSKVSQWYDAPDSVTIHGMDFVAVVNGPSTVDARVYLAGPDSLPDGAPIFSATLSIPADTNLAQYSLPFTNPVTVTGPYLLSMENQGATVVEVACSEWSSNEGRGEWLANGGAGNFWLRGYDVTLPGNERLDADALLQPHVSYRYDFDFTATPDDCIAFDRPIQLNSQISPIFRSRFYNRLYNPLSAFFTPDSAFIWYFSDTDSSFLANPTHSYPVTTPNPDSFTVELYGQVVGYRGFCPVDGEIKRYPWGPRADVSATATAGSAEGSFDFVLTGEAETWYWDFGDNTPFVFNQATPSHTYSTPGVYTARLIAESCNTQDTATVEVEFVNTAIALPEQVGLRLGSNPVDGTLTLLPQRAISQLTLHLLDAQGRTVWQARHESVSAMQRLQHDLRHLSAGVYWLRVQAADQQATTALQLR